MSGLCDLGCATSPSRSKKTVLAKGVSRRRARHSRLLGDILKESMELRSAAIRGSGGPNRDGERRAMSGDFISSPDWIMQKDEKLPELRLVGSYSRRSSTCSERLYKGFHMGRARVGGPPVRSAVRQKQPIDLIQTNTGGEYGQSEHS